ncbi:glycosyltransferase family 25 protein [Roseovarius sp.]|uniref:glycosyltransferase family 25 protein n=1 Tax=Roseovarius sp. TaxID=1486281 RepID=UPI003BAD879C
MTPKEIGAALERVFGRIYVINLASRPDRLAEIGDQFAAVGLTVGEGNVQRFDAARPAEPGPWPSVGARGCFMSHLGVLEDAVERGFDRITIVEDDLDWSRAFMGMGPAEVEALGEGDWRFLHGGLDSGQGPVRLAPLEAERAVLLAHFIALRGDAIGRMARYLQDMAARPPGSPEGGPMHVDGAYSWFRNENRDVPAAICVPALAHQRSSATDIAERRWFDRVPVVRHVVRGLRRSWRRPK